MRMLSKTLVALGLVAFLAMPALAQQGQRRGGFGFGGGGISMLLSNTSVQSELKLDADQIEKAKDLATKAREKFESERQSLEGLSGEERFQKMREIGKEVNQLAEKTAKEFLKPEQLKRLHQINLQQLGANAFREEHLQKKLKLTEDQKSSIDSIIQASNQEMREIFQSSQGDRQGAMAKLAELRKETLNKIEAKLTSEQKESYTKLLGSHFELRREGGPRR